MLSDAFNSAAHFQSWVDNIDTNKFNIVATHETVIVGFAGLFVYPENRKHVGWLALFVHEEFHNRGIGALLMRVVIAAADRVLKLRRVELTVICENHRAIDLYRRFGFEIEGRHDCFARRADEFVDVYTMSRIAEKMSRVGGDFTRRKQAAAFDSNSELQTSAPL